MFGIRNRRHTERCITACTAAATAAVGPCWLVICAAAPHPLRAPSLLLLLLLLLLLHIRAPACLWLTHHAAHGHVDHQLHARTSTHTAQEQAALALQDTSSSSSSRTHVARSRSASLMITVGHNAAHCVTPTWHVCLSANTISPVAYAQHQHSPCVMPHPSCPSIKARSGCVVCSLTMTSNAAAQSLNRPSSPAARMIS